MVPADSDWVRINGKSSDGYPYAGMEKKYIYIERLAAQKLGLAVLSHRWNKERHLLGMDDRNNVGMMLFVAAADELPNFLLRLHEGLEWLTLSQNDKRKLSYVVKSLSDLSDVSPGTRVYKAARKLDEILSELGNQGQQRFVGQIIGILAITNTEFRDLVYGSLRGLRETVSSSIDLEMPSATLKVPKAFGVMQHFYGDWQEMFPNLTRDHETLNLSYTVVVLAVTSALVKCTMLTCCPSSSALMNAVLDIGDVAYMT
ncbi:uncharacterized protein PG998_002887 [Apiospora kogelbergensis]|uniref:Uncharacterized protein n=1 Tax=Apiospora kogelbergensis TaxID=1337665 RepID=A0AAW0QAQ7_9PEZI